MLLGVFLVGMFLLTILLAAYGTDTIGSVTKTYTSTSSKGGTTYHVKYRYVAGDRSYTNSGTVSAATYATLSDPRNLEGERPTVRLRYLKFNTYHHEVLTQNHSAWTEAAQLALFALFWNGVLSIFVTVLWVLPIRHVLLIKHGEATPGTIISTRSRSGKSTTYYATFRFRDAESGREIEREMTIPGRAQYEAAEAGRAVTVIYKPGNPKRSVVYELSGCTVEGAQSS